MTARWLASALLVGCAGADPLEGEGVDGPTTGDQYQARDGAVQTYADVSGSGSPHVPPISSQGPSVDASVAWDASDEGALSTLGADAGGDGGLTTLTSDAGGDGALTTLTSDAGGDGGLTTQRTDVGGDSGLTTGRGDAATCGAVLPTYRGVPDVLVVLDRSCSMARSIYGRETFAADPNAKWNIAVGALRSVLSRYDSRLRWGVVAFPSVGEGCATLGGGVEPRTLVEPQPLGALVVQRALNGRDVAPFDVCTSHMQPHDTPLVRALEVAASARAFRDTTRPHYVLLVTDGIETCERDPVSALTRRAQALRDMGVRTWVVGFGRNEAPEQLDAIALAGGTAGPSTPRYATALDAAALDAALDAITGAAVDCSFSLREIPSDVARLRVVGSGPRVTRSIPRDTTRTEGWDYDRLTRTVTLYGTACSDVRSGTYTNLNVTYDCPASRCVPQPEVCDNLDNDCDGVRDDACIPPS